MNSSYNKNLNTILTESHYPHLTNSLFQNLTIPFGLTVQKNNKDQLTSCSSLTVCNNDVINNNLHDKLVELAEETHKKGKSTK